MSDNTQSREELLKKLRKKCGGRGKKNQKANIDYNKLNQMMNTFDTGEVDELRRKNKQLLDSMNMLMNPKMKDALENYDKIIQENKELKKRIEELENCAVADEVMPDESNP